MASSETGTYDPSLITLSVAGIVLGGFAEDEFVTVEQNAKRFEHKVGVLGDVARSRVLDRSALCTITLLGTSASNDDLSALATSDDNTPNGGGIGAFVLRDRGGTTLLQAADCWIEEVPPVAMARTIPDRVWKIRIAKLNSFTVGGATLAAP